MPAPRSCATSPRAAPGPRDRYANHGGVLVRLDPLTVIEAGGETVPFLATEEEWDGDILRANRPFITAVGAGTTYPDYKPAPFIVSQEVEGGGRHGHGRDRGHLQLLWREGEDRH